MNRSELEQEIAAIFEPVYDDDSAIPLPAPPHARLETVHKLNTSYWDPLEFSTTSPYSRQIREASDPLNGTMPSVSAPAMLFWSGVRLMTESLLAYCNVQGRRTGAFRYFPAILMTFCAGFEAFVRFQSEILAQVARELPHAVRLALLELEEYVERDGSVKQRRRQRTILERYWLILKYGHGYDFARGSKIWQAGQAALEKRNELVHYEVGKTPSLGLFELWSHMEAILLILIAPSADLKRSVYTSQFEIYEKLADLFPLLEQIGDFVEQPIHKDWNRKPWGTHIFACSFSNIDNDRYPSLISTITPPNGNPTT
jgi:hypothetical protein